MTDCGCTNFPASLGNVTFGASVGVGTTGPTAALDVASATAPQLVVRGGATTTLRLFPTGGSTSSVEAFATSDLSATNFSRLRLTVDGQTAGVIADAGGTGAALPLTFSAGGAERLRITTGGHVGVGAATPGYPLDIAAGAGVGLNVQGAAGDGVTPSVYLSRGAPASQQQPLAFRTGAAYDFLMGRLAGSDDLIFGPWPGSGPILERLRLTTGGNVGIGTTAPQQALDVAGTVRCTGVLLGGDQLMSGALKDSTGSRVNVDAGGCYYAP